jgi:hypothetical protein
MTDATTNVSIVTAAQVLHPLSAAIVRPREHVEAVLAQSLREMGEQGRAALAWSWALTGSRPSPVTLSLPVSHPPTREEILSEADAEPKGPPRHPESPATTATNSAKPAACCCGWSAKPTQSPSMTTTVAG